MCAAYACIVLICVLVIAILTLVDIRIMKQGNKSNFVQYVVDPDYKKELALFKSMDMRDQASYLNMSKQRKLVQYKPMLS